MTTPRAPRVTGLWLILAGVGLIGLGILLSRLAREGLVFTGLGATGIAVGIGSLMWPWTAEMVTANTKPGGNFADVWRLMPLFWKLWFALSVLVGVAVMFAFLIWW